MPFLIHRSGTCRRQAHSSDDCASFGGCPSDYVAIAITFLTAIIIICAAGLSIRFRDVPALKVKQIKVLVLQSVASIAFISSLLMSRNAFRLRDRKFWMSCYLWEVWLEGPLGFGLLLSCHIARAYRLYHLFVRKHLPPLKTNQLLILLLLPWITVSAVVQVKKPLNTISCCMGYKWWVSICMLHALYALLLLGGGWMIRKIEFEFQEFWELIKGVTICLIFLAIWIALYTANELEKAKRQWLEVLSRFILILMGNIFVLSFFWIPVSRPVLTHFSKQNNDSDSCETMGQALGVPHSGDLVPSGMIFNMDEPFETMLKHKRFRQSLLGFADSRMAGEFLNFYNDVHELNKISVSDTTRRVYMAGYIIEKYIKVGSPMELNISHEMRQEILCTENLASPSLFKQAINEAIQVMQMNLLNDYLQSSFFIQFKEVIQEEASQSEHLDRSGTWECPLEINYDTSSPHQYDDPFDQASQNGQLDGRESLEIATALEIATGSQDCFAPGRRLVSPERYVLGSPVLPGRLP